MSATATPVAPAPGPPAEAQSILRLSRIARVLPASSLVTGGLARRNFAATLERADLSHDLELSDVARVKQLLALVFLLLGVALTVATRSIAVFLLIGLGGAVIGYLLPDQQLKTAGNSRQRRVSAALPLALEVVGLTAERTSVDSAIIYYTEYFGAEELAAELTTAMQRVQQLKIRLDVSLGEMMRKNHNDDLSFLVAAVSQASSVGGTDLRKLLFEQAVQLRNKQALGVKARALRAPVLMTFPTMFNMVTLLILLGGLAYLQIPTGR